MNIKTVILIFFLVRDTTQRAPVRRKRYGNAFFLFLYSAKKDIHAESCSTSVFILTGTKNISVTPSLATSDRCVINIYMYGNHLRDSRSICRKNIATFLPWLFSFPRVLNHVRHIPGKISGYFHGTTRYLHTIAHAKNYNKSTEAKEKKRAISASRWGGK